jgi:hypothetical protein
MDYSVEQAKSLFDLLKSVSGYAMPLLISLIFPLFWVLLKKILGISKIEESNTISSSSNYFEKIIQKLRPVFSFLNGEYSDKIVFYSCILLFILGGILLKVGEKNEEELRQRALELKKYMEISNCLSIQVSDLNKNGFKEKLIRDIRYSYPNDFVAYTQNDVEYLAVVDTLTVKKIKKYVYSFIESYISAKFQNRNQVYVDSLMLYENSNDIKAYFADWLVFSFLSEQLNKEKYTLDVIKDTIHYRKKDGQDSSFIGGRTVIKKITNN